MPQIRFGEPVDVRVSAGDLSQLRKTPLVLKEGVTYRVKITFYVQREIVAGLKYVQQSYRGPLKGTLCRRSRLSPLRSIRLCSTEYESL